MSDVGGQTAEDRGPTGKARSLMPEAGCLKPALTADDRRRTLRTAAGKRSEVSVRRQESGARISASCERNRSPSEATGRSGTKSKIARARANFRRPGEQMLEPARRSGSTAKRAWTRATLRRFREQTREGQLEARRRSGDCTERGMFRRRIGASPRCKYPKCPDSLTNVRILGQNVRILEFRQSAAAADYPAHVALQSIPEYPDILS